MKHDPETTPSRYGGILAGVLASAAILIAAGLKATPYDNYVLLADALRHGRVWIDWPGPYIDALRYGGRYYVIEPPLPAVLLLPAVALFGTAVNQSVLAAILAGIATFAVWHIGHAVALEPWKRVLLCVVSLLGTDLFWCATFGDVWFVAHVAAVAFTFLALLELCGRRRAYLVALFAGCAFESRFTMLLAVPVYALMLWFGIGVTDRRRRCVDRGVADVAEYVLVLLAFAGGWIWYNIARWGVPTDLGYTAWFHQDSAGSPTGSPFELRYLGYQLQSFFVQGPAFIGRFPFVVPGLSGVALTWTSPALLLALLARRPALLVVSLWAAALACAVPDFLYYVNGYAQFGMRHALDFEPFLIVLIALAAAGPHQALSPLRRALCWYSIGVGAWGVWFWRAFVRP